MFSHYLYWYYTGNSIDVVSKQNLSGILENNLAFLSPNLRHCLLSI